MAAKPSLLVFAGATLLALLPAWGRIIYRYEQDPLTVVTWRALIATALLLLALAVRRHKLLPGFLALPLLLLGGEIRQRAPSAFWTSLNPRSSVHIPPTEWRDRIVSLERRMPQGKADQPSGWQRGRFQSEGTTSCRAGRPISTRS